ncbi:MAG: hypothetical protein N3F05_00620 [Candidatus Diapherotrites archaeon]|nr:hypothetical protein [Candidatus Diapherotrites archaeon]
MRSKILFEKPTWLGFFSPVDFFGVVYDLKPVSRTGISENDKGSVKKLAKGWGLECEVKRIKIYETKESMLLAYISKSRQDIEKAARAEANANRIDVGDLFGYPPCCTSFFIKTLSEKNPCSKQGGKYDYNLIERIFQNSKKLNFLLNSTYNFSSKGDYALIGNDENFIRISTYNLFFIPHQPCSFDCKESLKFGRKMQHILSKQIPAFCKSAEHFLKKPIIVWNDHEFCTFEGHKEGDSIRYSSIIGELSIDFSGFKGILSKGNSIIAKEDSLRVYSGKKFVGEIEKGLLLQFS